MCEKNGTGENRMELYRAGGSLSACATRSHITYCFPVPDGLRKLHLRFSYGPKLIAGELSRSLILSNLSDYIDEPGELKRVEASWEELGPVYNFITLSLDDPEGRFRGNVHRGDPVQEYSIGERVDECGCGLMPGPIGAGLWRVTLNVFAVYGEGCRYSLEVLGEARHA